jgi:hypothetical protein
MKKRAKETRTIKNIKDKLIAAFSVGIGFWLLNNGYYMESIIINLLTALISGSAFIYLLFLSIKAIRQKEKILGWVYLIMDIIMILSWTIYFFIGFFS